MVQNPPSELDRPESLKCSCMDCEVVAENELGAGTVAEVVSTAVGELRVTAKLVFSSAKAIR